MTDIYRDIRPFFDSEIPDVINEISSHPSFRALVRYIYPIYEDEDKLNDFLGTIKTSDDFISKITYVGLKKVLDKAAEKITYFGLENVKKDTSYLYISNHRDILLDAVILNFYLIENNYDTSRIAIGDNLIKKPLIKTLARLNKNFFVNRSSSSPREHLANSMKLSSYIKQSIFEENISIWIAQKGGRAKTGHDITNPAVLKMISMSREKGQGIVDYFQSLKLVPTSISYEYDPTDSLKIPELLAKENEQEYKKHRNEDIQNVAKGLFGQKKNISLSINKPLYEELEFVRGIKSENDKYKAIASIIDKEVIKSYKLWPTNYIAADIINNTDVYTNFYTEDERKLFEKRIDISSALFKNKEKEVRQNLLKMYSNPVFSYINISDDDL
ncbi:1-acyl-sn-glycerol-3-phosphate acyltransferase [Ichthyobacterium seriolicida]|uniref:Glycerol acyltransferase n=1 Tax=Ichthyobacterium seriolicida TaxID=242600 RepID=A0A1J1E7D3_9FLAO|nr:1-acyl-sn-glycerol-3-phosphate acyltransferase [Ichthyobacterium seriolicida]BAV95246.1 glycerol acyltransferase [Ichthyobacterium seriolicida]